MIANPEVEKQDWSKLIVIAEHSSAGLVLG